MLIEAEGEFKKVMFDPKSPGQDYMHQQDQAELLIFLDKNSDVFAW
jgi:hypothetical protein